SYVRTGEESGLFVVASQHKNRHGRDARDQLSDEGGVPETGSVESDHHQSKALCELRLLHKNEGFRGIGGALHVVEMTLEKRCAHKCLEWVVVDQQNSCHVLKPTPPQSA